MKKPLTATQRHPLTAAERTARVLRDNRNSPFCTPIPKAGDSKTTRATGVFASI